MPSCLLTGGYGRARMRAGWGPRCGGGALSALPFFESFRSRFCPRILLPGWLMKLLLGSERGNFRRLSCGLPVSWCPRLGRAFFSFFSTVYFLKLYVSDNFVRKGFGDRGSMHPSTLPCCCLLSQSSWANPSWTAEAAVKAAQSPQCNWKSALEEGNLRGIHFIFRVTRSIIAGVRFSSLVFLE